MKVIGRKEEILLLESLLQKEEAEFVAVYGRRRVGKTFLVREVYKKHIVFECSGLHNKSFGQQLENFWLTLQETNTNGKPTLPPKTWLQAFSQLKLYLNTLKGDGKKVVFLDEIPWFETPRSGFLAALDNFWNQYCTKREDIILVICGSAASWMIKKVINDTGGLHNRVTVHIQLMPFTLHETKMLLESKNVHLTLKDMAQLYMCIGGIPFYLRNVKAGKSIPQILDDLFFVRQASLKQEFDNLYAALFKNSELHEQIVAVLSTKNKGLIRSEIIEQAQINSGGGLSRALKELIECGFVEQVYAYYPKTGKSLYRLMDEYTLFYFKFLKNNKLNNSWLYLSNQNTYKIWLGYAFENLCLRHIQPIKQALGIHGIVTNDFTWSYRGDDSTKGTQIDLVIDRSDNCINIFELKFYNQIFEINPSYALQLQQKVEVFKTQTKTPKNVFLTFLTTLGVKKNKYYLSIVTNQLQIEHLFEEVRVIS
ncbi:MAG: ATP-binding protein [Chitinophagales bacterium]